MNRDWMKCFLVLLSVITGDAASQMAMPGGVALAQADNEGERVFRTASPSVVRIYEESSTGSGVIINENGLILTNHHVVGTAREFKVDAVVMEKGKLVTRTGLKATLKSLHPKYDLALVQLDAPQAGLRPCTQVLALPEKGAVCYALGSPTLGGGVLEQTITRGTVVTASLTDAAEGYPMIEAEVAVNPGNSGGALLDRQGRLLGIVTLKGMNDERRAYAIALGLFKQTEFLTADKYEALLREKNKPKISGGSKSPPADTGLMTNQGLYSRPGWDAANPIDGQKFVDEAYRISRAPDGDKARLELLVRRALADDENVNATGTAWGLYAGLCYSSQRWAEAAYAARGAEYYREALRGQTLGDGKLRAAVTESAATAVANLNPTQARLLPRISRYSLAGLDAFATLTTEPAESDQRFFRSGLPVGEGEAIRSVRGVNNTKVSRVPLGTPSKKSSSGEAGQEKGLLQADLDGAPGGMPAVISPQQLRDRVDDARTVLTAKNPVGVTGMAVVDLPSLPGSPIFAMHGLAVVIPLPEDSAAAVVDLLSGRLVKILPMAAGSTLVPTGNNLLVVAEKESRYVLWDLCLLMKVKEGVLFERGTMQGARLIGGADSQMIYVVPAASQGSTRAYAIDGQTLSPVGRAQWLGSIDPSSVVTDSGCRVFLGLDQARGVHRLAFERAQVLDVTWTKADPLGGWAAVLNPSGWVMGSGGHVLTLEGELAEGLKKRFVWPVQNADVVVGFTGQGAGEITETGAMFSFGRTCDVGLLRMADGQKGGGWSVPSREAPLGVDKKRSWAWASGSARAERFCILDREVRQFLILPMQIPSSTGGNTASTALAWRWSGKFAPGTKVKMVTKPEGVEQDLVTFDLKVGDLTPELRGKKVLMIVEEPGQKSRYVSVTIGVD